MFSIQCTPEQNQPTNENHLKAKLNKIIKKTPHQQQQQNQKPTRKYDKEMLGKKKKKIFLFLSKFVIIYFLLLCSHFIKKGKNHKSFSSITVHHCGFGSCQLEKDKEQWEGKHFKREKKQDFVEREQKTQESFAPPTVWNHYQWLCWSRMVAMGRKSVLSDSINADVHPKCLFPATFYCTCLTGR